ncbi:MAG: Gfo/Idh/MocA family oxidoreductase [Clostridia bacterium]|nr:Gfo/Idh/MocA family oxidoreductase [Clostridia bacterium]
MAEKPFGWCFLGTGTLAQNVAKEIVPSGRHRIVSTFSRNFEKNKAFADSCGATPCRSAEEAIQMEGVDAVYIVVPHPGHYTLTKLALTLGKPVLCEKPFTVDAKQSKELFDLAKEKRLYLAEAMWTWFAPTAQRVKSWVEEGRFGTISFCHANYHMNGQGYAARVTDPKQAGGALLDIGVYAIHYLYRLFGKPAAIRCEGRLKDGIDWGEEITMTYPNGFTATASTAIDNYKGLERLTIKGDKAKTSVFLFHMTNKAKLKKGLRTLDAIDAYGGMLNEFDLVSDEIREGRTESRFVPQQATQDVMELLDECRRQMQLVYPFEKA